MKDHVLRAAQVNLGYARKLVADIPDENMSEQPKPGMNHAAWVIGHLTFVADSMARVFDLPFTMPKEWVELFNLSSKPTAERAKYPSKAALMEAYEKAYARLIEAVRGASHESLAREFPNPKLRETAADGRRGHGSRPVLAPRPAPGPALGLAAGDGHAVGVNAGRWWPA